MYVVTIFKYAVVFAIPLFKSEKLWLIVKFLTRKCWSGYFWDTFSGTMFPEDVFSIRLFPEVGKKPKFVILISHDLKYEVLILQHHVIGSIQVRFAWYYTCRRCLIVSFSCISPRQAYFWTIVHSGRFKDIQSTTMCDDALTLDSRLLNHALNCLTRSFTVRLCVQQVRFSSFKMGTTGCSNLFTPICTLIEHTSYIL